MAKYTLDQIIDAGRKTYAKYGEDFRMSDVAKELETRASTLYRHVNTKRELYFAILTKEFNEFEQVIVDLTQQLRNPTPLSILKEVGSYILKMAREDKERFLLMFMTKPPDQGPKLSEKLIEVGPHEKACNPQTIGFIQNLVVQHLQKHDFDTSDTSLTRNIAFFLVSLVIGAGFVVTPTYEYSNQDLIGPEDYEEFHDFVIENSLKLWTM